VPYAVVFLEGIVTFVSPCLLPMLPVYVSYFIGGEPEDGQRHTLRNALGFVLGFTAVFVTMGAFAAGLGRFLVRYRTAADIASGAVVVLLGLQTLGALHIGFLNRGARTGAAPRRAGFLPSLLFGLAFSVGWTPCVGAFLGSALLLASREGTALRGVLMLLLYSLGLGIPFVVGAVLLERLKGMFGWLRRHNNRINRVAGVFLVLTGVLMAFGWLGRLLSLLTG
jgi:cytochrome c-type biogenesis protein